jgi:tRNA pseudouridine38-40 synthase
MGTHLTSHKGRMRDFNKTPLNIVITLSYDGTSFQGWQDNHSNRSIEGALKKALFLLFNDTPSLQAASRTDAGVHATGQVVNFFLQDLEYPLSELKYRLNRVLPKDLVVHKISKGSFSFHPTLDCIEKTYHYEVSLGEFQLPRERLYSWHYPYPIQWDKLEKMCQFLQGKELDFTKLSCQQSSHPYSHHKRFLSDVSFSTNKETSLKLVFKGQSFFYKLVRRLSGTLLALSSVRLKDDLESVLNTKTNSKGGMTAPAHGLHLIHIKY